MNSNQLKTKYQLIWDDHQASKFNTSTESHDLSLLERGFVFQYDEDERECELLFIGINPAMNREHGPWKDSYQRPIENDDEKHLAYFKSFVSIAKELRSPTYHWQGKWTHIDIFAFRETNQNFIKTNLLNPKNQEGIDFLYTQLMIARERIIHIRPKVIVVSNALVRMFMGKERGFLEDKKEEYGVWMDFRFEFDPEIGTDVIIEPQELKGTYVFFTSMLSGQRALDNGSKERLVWHIARALK